MIVRYCYALTTTSPPVSATASTWGSDLFKVLIQTMTMIGLTTWKATIAGTALVKPCTTISMDTAAPAIMVCARLSEVLTDWWSIYLRVSCRTFPVCRCYAIRETRS